MTTPWYEDDTLWTTLRPVLFPSDRIESATAEIDGIIRLLDLEPPAKILDMPCGVGRHALELARRGFQVTAVDRTKSYLDEARDLAAKEGLDIEFVESDMRMYRSFGTFDAALNLFSSFGYFEAEEDNHGVAEAFSISLRQGGKLIVDTMSKEILARDFEKRRWSEADGVFLLEELTVERDFSWINNRWIVLDKESNRRELNLQFRVYSATELKQLFRKAGFSSVQCTGDLAKEIPFDEGANRLVLVATR